MREPVGFDGILERGYYFCLMGYFSEVFWAVFLDPWCRTWRHVVDLLVGYLLVRV